MRFIKKIDTYLLTNFLTTFFATFFICLFILMMQFLWLHINEMVGKGLPTTVLLQFFFYAGLTLIPLALPLAILLASLMTFGDMGEKLELLAMKSAGVSLFRIMRILTLFIAFLSVGAFFFSNNVIPVAQKRMWTLMFSIREKSPELDIPVGEFYSGINNMRLYVRNKNMETSGLEDVMIYDFSKGFENASVTTADTVYVRLTEDKMNLKLTLVNGESFENLDQGEGKMGKGSVPYRRESFARKEVLIDFDANFNLKDESMLSNQHVSKDIVRLTNDIDSINVLRDSLRTRFSNQMVQDKYYARAFEQVDTLNAIKPEVVYNADTLFLESTQGDMVNILRNSKTRIESVASDLQYNRVIIDDADKYYTRHSIEWYRKFTLSFACLTFFFIGAPLGSIIRKGGLGMPVVISVVMFIIYYIIDTMGQKMARQGVLDVWQGMWLSSAILLPIGIFLTYKAARDSAIMNPEAIGILIKRQIERVRSFFKKKRAAHQVKTKD